MSSTPLNEATSAGQSLSRLDDLKSMPGLVAQRLARRRETISKSHHAGLLSRDAPAGEYQIKRVAVTDETRQADRPPIDEWNSPAAVIHAKNGILGSNPQVAPEREFEAASNGIALYRRNHGLAEKHARDTQRSIPILGNAQSPRSLRHSSEIEA